MKRPSEWLKQLTRDELNLRSMEPVLNQATMTGDSELWSRVRKLIVDVTIALETPWEGPVGSDPYPTVWCASSSPGYHTLRPAAVHLKRET